MKVNNFFEVNMRIHRVRREESAADIAKEHGIDEQILKRSNDIHDGDRL